MTEFQVWLWFVVLPGMRDALVYAAWMTGMLAALISVCICVCFEILNTGTRKLLPIKTAIALIIITITLPFIRAIMPTEKQATAIILIPAVTQSERVRGIGDKTLDALNGKLDQWLKDMAGDVQRPEKGEKL